MDEKNSSEIKQTSDADNASVGSEHKSTKITEEEFSNQSPEKVAAENYQSPSSSKTTTSENSSRIKIFSNWAFIAALLTVASGLLTTNTALKINEVKDTLAIQMKGKEQIIMTTAAVKTFLRKERKRCIGDKYTGSQKNFYDKMSDLNGDIIIATRLINEIFDYQLAELSPKFVKLALKNENICSVDFPSEKEFDEIQTKIDLIMRRFTDRSRNRIKELSSWFF